MAKVPNLVTEIPGPKSQELIKQRNEYVPAGVYLVQPVTIARSKGALMEDVDGNTLLDFTSGIGVTSLGHCTEEIVETITAQAKKLIHSCIHVGNYQVYTDLAKKLCEITPGDYKKRALMLNSGSEAVENAVKIVRQSTGRPNILSFENSFHGRTYMAMTLTAKWDPYKVGLGPFVPGVYFTPYPYSYRCPWGTDDKEECGKAAIHHIEKSVFKTQVDPSTVGAIITETIQGEGGFIDPPKNFYPMLKEVADKHDIKIIMDANAVSAVEPTQIARVQRFLEQRRGRDGIIREDRFNFDVIKAIAPQCASHLPVIYPILPIATSTPPPNPP